MESRLRSSSQAVREANTSKIPWVVRATKKIVPETFQQIKNTIPCVPKKGVTAPKPKKSVSHRILAAVRSGDMFGFSPIVQLDSFRTMFGGFCTILCLTGILIYMVVTGVRFFDASINKSQVVIDTDQYGIEMPLAGIRFNDVNGNPFYNDSYFYFVMSINVVVNSVLANKTTIYIPLKNCDYYTELNPDFTPLAGSSPIYSDVLCPDLDAFGQGLGSIVGIFENPYFRYLQIDMFRCKGESPSGQNCTDPTTIDNMVTGGEVAIMWYNSALRDVIGVDPHLNLRRLWKSYRFKFALGLVVSKDIYFTKDNVTHHSAWPLGKQDLATVYHEDNMIDAFSSFTDSSKPRYTKFILRADERMIQEDWTPELFFDLLGSWGAFWSVLLLLIGTCALIYNEKKWNFLVAENSLALEGAESPVLNVIEKKFARATQNSNDSKDVPLTKSLAAYLTGRQQPIGLPEEEEEDAPVEVLVTSTEEVPQEEEESKGAEQDNKEQSEKSSSEKQGESSNED